MHRSLDDHLWLATTRGLVEFSGSQIRTYTTDHGLSENATNGLAEDGDGNLWIGSDSGGAMRLARSGFTNYTTVDGLAQPRADSIFLDRAGEVCITTSFVTINRYSGNRCAVRPNLPRQAETATAAYHQSILQDHAGEWWVPTGAGLYRFPNVANLDGLATVRPKAVYRDRAGMASNTIFRLFEDSRGDLFISYTDSGKISRWDRATDTFYQFTEADGLTAQSRASTFVEDHAGNVWAGFWNGGLARYRSGRFTMLSASDGVPDGMIRALYIDRAGRLWVCTSRRGLGRVDEPGAPQVQFLTYDTSNGLGDNEVNCVTEDRSGFIYVGMGRGLGRLDPASGRIKHYTTSDGLLSTEIIRCIRDRRDTLWFATARAVARLTPQREEPKSSPQILITGVEVAGRPLTVSELGETEISAPELQPDQNTLQINFLSLSFSLEAV